MSWTRTLDDDPVTASRTVVSYDSAADTMTVSEQQDVSAIAEIANEYRKAEPSWRPWKGDWHLVGQLPNVVYWDLWKQGRLPSQDVNAFRKWWATDGKVWATKTGRL
jgi:hypothetical protein